MATAADIRAWYGKIPYTMQCMLLEINGEPVAIGGLARQNGQMIAFMDMKPEAQKYPVLLMKSSKKVMNDIIEKSIANPVVKPDEQYPNARNFLKRLGFEELTGGILICRH